MAVSTDLLGFIESTLSISRAGDLASALADASGAEYESVAALLFFPDEALQLEIEETLAGRALTFEDEQRLALRLAEHPPRVTFDFPGGRGRLRLEMRPERVREFLTHLRLTRPVPKELADAIDALAPAARSRFRVLWRNARCPASGATVRVLGRFLPRIELQDRDEWACLGFLLEFLDEAGEGTDTYRRLAMRKALLVSALDRSRRQRAELARGNLETLISRGVRLVVVDEKEARRQVACIDQACLAVYGRIEAIDIDTVTLYDTGYWT
ncbi:MAG: hypothetical protein R6V84_10435 [Desulfobacterales bacterium]